jgi:hypothetical protein
MFTFLQPHVPCAYNQHIHTFMSVDSCHFLSLGIELIDQMHVSLFIHIEQDLATFRTTCGMLGPSGYIGTAQSATISGFCRKFDRRKAGANPTTFEFTATTPAL